MITITLTDADAEAYITAQTTATVAAAVEQIDDLPKDIPKEPRKRASRAKANKAERETGKPELKEVPKETPVEGELVDEIPVPDAVEPDVDALRTKFEALVIADYDAAAELIDGFGDGMTFGKIAGEATGDLLREFAVKLEQAS